MQAPCTKSMIMLILKKVKCENIMKLFIQKIGHIIAKFVSLVILQWTFWKDMLIIFLSTKLAKGVTMIFMKKSI